MESLKLWGFLHYRPISFVVHFLPVILSWGWFIVQVLLFVIMYVAYGIIDVAYCTFEVVRINDGPVDCPREEYWVDLAEETRNIIPGQMAVNSTDRIVTEYMPMTGEEYAAGVVRSLHKEITCRNWGALGREPAVPIAFGYLIPIFPDTLQGGFNLFFSLLTTEVQERFPNLPILDTGSDILTLTLRDYNPDGLPSYVYATYLNDPSHLSQLQGQEGAVDLHLDINECIELTKEGKILSGDKMLLRALGLPIDD